MEKFSPFESIKGKHTGWVDSVFQKEGGTIVKEFIGGSLGYKLLGLLGVANPFLLILGSAVAGALAKRT